MGLLTASDVPENAAMVEAVDVAIAVAEGLVAVAIVAVKVLIAKCAACAVDGTLVVMAVLVVIVHVVTAANVAVATVNVTTALLCPLFATAAVNVLAPQPCMVGEARFGAVPVESDQSGSAIIIVSPCASALEHWNVSTTALTAPAMGLLTTSDVPENAATAVAVELAIGVVAGLVAAAIVAPMVRVCKFANWTAAATPVVMSALVVMVHAVPAASAAVATVNVTAALFCPVFATAAVNVLVPHPCLVGAVPEASTHVGNTTTIVSPCASALEHWNVSTTALAAPAMGLLTTKDVPENAATAVAVDVVIATAEGLVAAAIVAPMVRVARFTA